MTNLEKLYYNMDKLNDDYVDTKEVKSALNNLKTALGRELYVKYEDEIVKYASECEKQGFMIGFQYVVSLMTSGKGGAA